MNNFTVEFFGQAAHGAVDPWNGRSALDAVEMMNYGVNLMREHIEPSARIHYVITDGGQAPNVVPEYAKVWYFVRDVNRNKVQANYDHILKIAEAAAMATKTTHKVTLVTGVHENMINRPLLEVMQKNLMLVGPIQVTEEEQQWGKALQKAAGKEEIGYLVQIAPLKDTSAVLPLGGGSTDVAEVSYITPTTGFNITSAPAGVPWHSWATSASHNYSVAMKTTVAATKALAYMGIDMLTHPELLKKAKAYHLRMTEGIPYVSPVPDDQKAPLTN